MVNRICWDDYGTGSRLHTWHWGNYWEGIGLLVYIIFKDFYILYWDVFINVDYQWGIYKTILFLYYPNIKSKKKIKINK
jgi:hypothetical protein